DQNAQALTRNQQSKEPYSEAISYNPRSGFVTIESDSQRHHAHLTLRHPQIAAHKVRVILADRREAVHVLHIGAHQFERLAKIRLRKLAEKQILALQRDA